jgi:hypothetical protein
MPSPTSTTNSPTSGHPQIIATGPPVFIPNPYSVKHPERTEMIVNDTAKFENDDIVRFSSCA